MRAPAPWHTLITIAGEHITAGADGSIWLTELDARGACRAGYTDIP